MKRSLYIFVGALVCLILGVLITVPVNHWYTANFVKSEDDVGVHLWVSLLLIWPLFLVLGGWLGNRLYRKNLTTR